MEQGAMEALSKGGSEMSVANSLTHETGFEASSVESEEQMRVLNDLLVGLLSDMLVENLERLVHEPLPPMVSFIPLLRDAQIQDSLRLLSNRKRFTDRDLWEAFLTPEVEQTLLEALAKTLVWRWKANAPVIPYETLRTVQGALQTLPAVEQPTARSSSQRNKDEQVLQMLHAFPRLQATYRSTLEMSPEDLVRELSDTLTDGLIGYMVGVSDRAVRDWVRGKYNVHKADVTKLRVALTALRILLEKIKPRVSLRWFANRNSVLEEGAPAEMIQKGQQYDWVIRAAAAYAQDGA